MKTISTTIKRNFMIFLLAFTVLFSTVAVVQPQSVQAASKNRIVLNMTKRTAYTGEYYTVKAIAVYQNGELKSPGVKKNGLGYKGFSFSSSNKSVATVSKKGVITTKKAGIATITVTSIYDRRVKGTVNLTVKKAKKKTITLKKKSAVLHVGNTTTIRVKKVKSISSKEMIYKSNNKEVATVNKYGVVTAKAEGTATITVTSKINKKTKVNFKVTVDEKLPQDIEKVEKSITLKQKEGYIANIVKRPGEPDPTYATTQIEVKSVKGLNSKDVTFQSMDESRAVVNEDGVVSFAKNPAYCGDVKIVVTSKEDKSVKTEYTIHLKEYQQYKNLNLNEEWGSYYDKEDGGFETYCSVENEIVTSSNPEIVKIERCTCKPSDWKLNPIREGSATITYKTRDGLFLYSYKITVSNNKTIKLNGASGNSYGLWWAPPSMREDR